MTKLIVTCPKCGDINSYDNHCHKCNGVLDWKYGNIKETQRGIECIDCRDVTWEIECPACQHSIPLIGKLSHFDSSDEPVLQRIFVSVINFFFKASRPY